tara:strand:+ start:295 stop:582 length:288 start_codon:yes stop_codon:yes gene_type:complete
MAKEKGKGKFKVEFYHGDHDADHSHVSPRAEYFDNKKDAEHFVQEVQHSSGSSRKGNSAKEGFGPGTDKGWRLHDAGGSIKERPADPPAPEPAPW